MTACRAPSLDRVAAHPARVIVPRTARELAQEIQHGGVLDDELFDRFLPFRLRVMSRVFWTPLVVTDRVAAWFAELGVVTVVDIGSGAGKFCVAAALAGGGRFLGLEQRPSLVKVARRLARAFGVDDRVEFVEGILDPGTVPAADAYYLFNPFGENRFGPEAHLDEDVELSEDRYRRDIAGVEDMLRRARPGTYVVTYNGFGGAVPDDYTEIRIDCTLPNLLQMWRKAT